MADAIVVGSGPVGAVAARRLAEGGRDVVILERGAAISSPPGSHVRNAAAYQRDPDSYLGGIVPYLTYFDPSASPAGLPGASETSAVGGQGVLWTNNCPRATIGLELDDAIAPEEWDRYYDLAEDYLGVRCDQFEASSRQRHIRSALDASLAVQSRRIVSQPMAGSVVGDGRIHFNATSDVLEAGEAATVEIRRVDVEVLRARSGQVDGVTLADGQSLDAPLVVVAAGAFGTPSLLHRSGIQPPSLGRHLTYHAVVVAQLVLDDGLFDPSEVRDLPPRLMIPPTASHPWHTMVLRDVNPFPRTPPDESISENRVVEIQSFCPIDIVESNAMTIADGRPPTFDVPITGDDQARMDAVVADVEALTAHLGRFRAGCHPQWMDLGFAHVMGTCRMGDDPVTSVADPRGQVWGVDGLFLAGAGVIPTRLAVNPTLTAAALAIRGVDHALGR